MKSEQVAYEKLEGQGFKPWRQINTFILFITALCNSMIVQALSAINKQIVQYLPGVSSTQVSACALLFMIIHPFAAFPVNYVLDHYSLKVAISIDCCMVIVGICLRIFVLNGFAWVIIGNIIVAVGNAFILYCPAKYSAIWYPPTNRLLITGLIIFANNVSGGVGAFISPFFVKQNLPIEEGQQSIKNLMIFQAIIVGSVMILNLIFFRGKPKSNIIGQNVETNDRLKAYIQTLKKLFNNKEFRLIFFSLFLFLSSLNSLLTNVELLIIPFGLGSREAGLSAVIVLPAALIGSVITSIIIKKTFKYKKVILIEIVLSTISIFILFFGLSIQITPLFWFGIVCTGLFGFPIISNIVQYACQVLHPFGEATISGIILAGGQLMSFLLGLMQAKIASNSSRASILMIVGMDIIFFGIAFILIKLSTQKLNRLEQKKKQKNSGSLFSEDDDSNVSDN